MENVQNPQSLNETQVKLPWTVYPQQTQVQNQTANKNKQQSEFWF